jgi:uncharacterized protein (DUF39 family)
VDDVAVYGPSTVDTFNNLTINKSSGTATLGRNIYVGGNLTVNAGTLDLGTYAANHIGAIPGTLAVANGATLMVGIGVPIPVLSEEILRYTAVKDEEIFAAIVDYSEAYPQMKPDILGEVSYAQLKGGKIVVQGKDVPTASLSSYAKAVEIAQILKKWINQGEFLLTEPVVPLPVSLPQTWCGLPPSPSWSSGSGRGASMRSS